MLRYNIIKLIKIFTIVFLIFYSLNIFLLIANAADNQTVATTTTSPESQKKFGITLFKQIEEKAFIGGLSSANTGIADVIGIVLGSLFILLGVLFIILIIYGGILWMTAGGNEEQVKKAQKYIINAIIGLIIVILANVIVSFAFNILQPEPPSTSQT